MIDCIEIFTIYDKPSDFPESVIIRRWVLSLGKLKPDQEPFAITDKLESAREELAKRRPGLVGLGRNQYDDPVILESWF